MTMTSKYDITCYFKDDITEDRLTKEIHSFLFFCYISHVIDKIKNCKDINVNKYYNHSIN